MTEQYTQRRRFERSDTPENWTAKNPILGPAEWAYEKNTKRVKIGDGVTPWNALPYLETQNPSGLDRFEFVQESAAAVWSIVHNLGRYPAAVMTVDAAGAEILGAVEHYSLAEVRVYFASPVSGAAYLI